MAIAEWTDGTIFPLPEPCDRDILHVADRWLFEASLRPHPVYAALGWAGVRARAIRHPPPTPPHPVHRYKPIWAVGCEDCVWSQRVDDEALDNGADWSRLRLDHVCPANGVRYTSGRGQRSRTPMSLAAFGVTVAWGAVAAV